MSDSQIFDRLTLDTLEEHRQIHFFLDQVGQSLQSLDDDLTDVEPVRRLAAQLQGLSERLAEHNQAEQCRGGLFQAILEVMPHKRVEVDRLLNQHARIADMLEMARLHALGCEPASAKELRADLEGFLQIFREHEEAEEQLIARAIEKEAGAID